MSALSTPIHEQLEQKIKKKRKQRAHPNDQKPKNGSFENEQNLVPKDMGNGSTQPSKTKLALEKR
jgi:hypothetical protein